MPTARVAAIIDVGHGGSCVIHGDNNAYLIDCGPGAHVLEYLAEAGTNHLQTVILSHSDADHIKGLTAILGEGSVQVENVVFNADSLQGSKHWKAMAYELDKLSQRRGLEVEIGLQEGRIIPLDIPDLHLRVVAPRIRLAAIGPGGTDDSGARVTTNSISAVIALRNENQNQNLILFAGDLDEVGLDHLLDSDEDIRSRILIFPHHGGNVGPDSGEERNASFAENLLEAVSPEVVVFSIGRGRYGTPRPEITDSITSRVPRPRIICTQLSEHCAATSPTEAPSHLSSRFAAGKHRKNCCGGTLLINVMSGDIVPDAASHMAFIRREAPSALCDPTL